MCKGFGSHQFHPIHNKKRSLKINSSFSENRDHRADCWLECRRDTGEYRESQLTRGVGAISWSQDQ